MASDWEYGGAYQRHPVEGKRVVFSDGSIVQPHNIFQPLPEFMLSADLLFIDPPWNIGNVKSFYTKAGRNDFPAEFSRFYSRLFACIADIKPRACYVEAGKEYLAEFIMEMKRLYRSVTFYNSTYYHRSENLCYVIRGSAKRQKLPLEGMDEEDVIRWLCTHEEYDCIGDLCMGRGLVGLNANANGRRFVGTELNHRRLAVLVDKLAAKGETYEVSPL